MDVGALLSILAQVVGASKLSGVRSASSRIRSARAAREEQEQARWAILQAEARGAREEQEQARWAILQAEASAARRSQSRCNQLAAPIPALEASPATSIWRLVQGKALHHSMMAQHSKLKAADQDTSLTCWAATESGSSPTTRLRPQQAQLREFTEGYCFHNPSVSFTRASSPSTFYRHHGQRGANRLSGAPVTQAGTAPPRPSLRSPALSRFKLQGGAIPLAPGSSDWQLCDGSLHFDWQHCTSTVVVTTILR